MWNSRPKKLVTMPQTSESYVCAIDENLLQGMIRLGRKGIPVGCVNGGCGICKIKIIRGTVKKLGPISRAHVTEEEERNGYTLACRVGPASDVVVEVIGKMVKPFTKGYGKKADRSC